MRRELAEQIAHELLACSGRLDRSVGALEGVMEAEAFRDYRRLVGRILGLFYIDVLRNIFSHYPDLEPKSMK
jgi:hypothetical protein